MRRGVLLIHGLAGDGLGLDGGRPPAARRRPDGRARPARPRPVGRADDEYDPATLADDVVAVAEGSGVLDGGRAGRRGSCWPATASAAWSRLGGRRARDRCAGLVLVDGGWEDLARGDRHRRRPSSCAASPNRRRCSLDGRLPRRPARLRPATWDADQERAARATVVEVPAGHVVPATRPHAIERSVEAIFEYRPLETLASLDLPIVALVAVDDDHGTTEPCPRRDDSARRSAGRGRSRGAFPQRPQPDALPTRRVPAAAAEAGR